MQRRVHAIEIYSYPQTRAEAEEDLDEFLRLIDAAGWRLQGSEICQLRKMNYDTGLGSGKLAELKEAFKRKQDIDLIVLDYELKPYQIKNIEDFFNIEVSDRTRLILEIFKRRAHTAEGKLQVELAEAEYEIGRLVGGRGLELSRLGGGIGTKGPGEKIMEKERRAYKRKIKNLREKLEKVRMMRSEQRKHRQKEGYRSISLVGYTNAGKSTLLNALAAGQEAKAKDELFTTVEPTTRLICLEAPVASSHSDRTRQMVMVTDTVGFIRKLPHELVEGFESTLEQVKLSDLVLVIVDVADPKYEEKQRIVLATLERIGCTAPILKVYNKFDLLTDPRRIDQEAVYLSARQKEGLDELRAELLRLLAVQPL